MHYFNSDPKDADYASDMQLPFKSHTQCQLTTIATILFDTYSEIPHVVYSDFKVRRTSDENLLPGDFLSAIWQPPRA